MLERNDKMRIQLNVPQAYDVVVMLDKTELRFNKKNKKITKQLSPGNHKLQVRQVNMLATSVPYMFLKVKLLLKAVHIVSSSCQLTMIIVIC